MPDPAAAKKRSVKVQQEKLPERGGPCHRAAAGCGRGSNIFLLKNLPGITGGRSLLLGGFHPRFCRLCRPEKNVFRASGKPLLFLLLFFNGFNYWGNCGKFFPLFCRIWLRIGRIFAAGVRPFRSENPGQIDQADHVAPTFWIGFSGAIEPRPGEEKRETLDRVAVLRDPGSRRFAAPVLDRAANVVGNHRHPGFGALDGGAGLVQLRPSAFRKPEQHPVGDVVGLQGPVAALAGAPQLVFRRIRHGQFRQLFPDDVLAVPQKFVHLAAHQVIARMHVLVVQERLFEFFPAQVDVEVQDALQGVVFLLPGGSRRSRGGGAGDRCGGWHDEWRKVAAPARMREPPV
ncbi:MAG: hypothetical protein IPM98_20840 [Lewinellaceae bacterium]|nr:hypothetical protein [Lewinellaceae bacterium]